MIKDSEMRSKLTSEVKLLKKVSEGYSSHTSLYNT